MTSSNVVVHFGPHHRWLPWVVFGRDNHSEVAAAMSKTIPSIPNRAVAPEGSEIIERQLLGAALHVVTWRHIKASK
jgi:hypothetical protein